MATFLRSYRFGIAALQSIRVLEAVARPPRGVKLQQRYNRNYSTTDAQPVGNGIHTSDQGQELVESGNDDTKLAELKAMEETVTDPEIKKEIAAYYEGKRRLAVMMGCDPDTFTEQDVDDAIRYLLPSGLTAKHARPFLKHPLEYYPKKNIHFFDADGRPLEAGFYTGLPAYHNLVYEVLEKTRQLDERYAAVRPERLHKQMESEGHKTSASSSPQNHTRWVNLAEMQDQLKERISEEQYELVLGRLKALAGHPMAEAIQPFLDQYRRMIVVLQQRKERIELDENGVAYATGKRKTAEAEVTVSKATVSGEGTIMVNQSSLLEMFPLIQTRQQVLFPLMLVNALGQFDVTATVQNGGSTGQAGAIRHALSNALAAFSDDYYQTLEKAGLLRRDCRRKERKKPGQKKARKKFAWVKR